MDMQDFVTAYRAMIELYMLCYNDLLKQGMTPVDATRNTKAIMEIIFNMKSQEDKNND